jgi:hypothetical protein
MQKLDQMAGRVNLYSAARPLDAQRTLYRCEFAHDPLRKSKPIFGVMRGRHKAYGGTDAECRRKNLALTIPAGLISFAYE